MNTEIFVVENDCVGLRLDAFISNKSDNISRSRAKTCIEEGKVSVNSKEIKKSSYSVRLGDEVSVLADAPVELTAEPENIPIDIVYQDSDFAVINKRQGMVTHPALGSPNGTLVNALLYHIKDLSTINGVIRPGIVHRLDKDTSGLIVIAKNDKAHQSLSEQIAEKSAKRRYIALVDGNIREDSGSIETNIDRNRNDRKKMAVVTVGGRYARTDFTVEARYGQYTLVKYQLYTGRTHQIRVHSKHIPHSVVGDSAYGGSNKFKLDGQLLHAYELELSHPTTGEHMVFSAPLPSHFVMVLEKLKSSLIVE
ncbi:MAG: RluA family pseudouridine synthase [Bacillota bacterium]